MVVILEKDDLIPESRNKTIDEIEFRHDFIYDWAGNHRAILVILKYQGELKVFRAFNTNWEGMVYDGEKLFSLIQKAFIQSDYQTTDLIYSIKNLAKILDKNKLEKLTYELQAELFKRS